MAALMYVDHVLKPGGRHEGLEWHPGRVALRELFVGRTPKKADALPSVTGKQGVC